MPIPNKPSYSHGSTGTQPGSPLDYANGDPLDADNFDYFVHTPFSKISGIIDALNNIDSNDDGKVDAADTADSADTASAYKGNDIDSDGDGKVDAADTADSTSKVKGNDIDSDGDGIVDAADSANAYKGNDIDSDGDGVVDEADDADTVDGYEGETLLHSGGRINLPSKDINTGDFTALVRYPSLPSDATLHVERATITNGSFSAPTGLNVVIYDATNDTVLKTYNGYQDVSEDIDVGGRDVIVAADNGNFTTGTGSDQSNVTAELACTLQ